MTARLALVFSLLALVLALVSVRHEGSSVLHVEQHHAKLAAADGGRVLTSPPAAAPTTPMAGNPAAYRFVRTYWAQDLHRYSLSSDINAAAHAYGLSPVGLLAVTLSECRGYTHGPICSREAGGCDYSWGATQINVCTAAQYGVGNGSFDGDGGSNTTRVRTYEENARRAIWLAARVLRHFRDVEGGHFPALDIAYNCGSYGAYIYGSQCYANHAHFLANWWLAARFGTNTRPKPAAGQPQAVGFDLLDSPAVERRLWRLPATSVIESSTYGEAGLTGGFQPIRDTDVMVPQWTHQRMYLPGGKQDTYHYRGCYYIAGSGFAALWLTPTDAYFAILHMTKCPFASVSASPPIRYTGPVPKSQDDATGPAFAWMMHHAPQAGALRTVRGGSYVGLTGWPSSYQYSNGSCYSAASCGIDAHQCQILTMGASNWFLWLAAGHDRPKPKPVFKLKAWNHYTSTHHKHVVPAYHKGGLRPESRYWWHHTKALGYVMHEERWTQPKHKPGYESMPFTKRDLRYYPKSHKFIVVKR
jgi:hypothetical protein